jgi:hypothetical protein
VQRLRSGGRTVELTTTPAGTRLVRKWYAAVETAMTETLSGLDEAERDTCGDPAGPCPGWRRARRADGGPYLPDVPVGPLLAVLIYAVSGVVWGPYSTVETTALQRWTRASHHGRVFGTQRALLQSVLPVVAALGAVAVDHTSAVVVLGVSLAGCSLAGLAALALPAMRQPTTTPTTTLAPLGEAQIAFAELLGPLTTAHPTVNTGSARVLSVKANRGMATNSWHTDVTFADRVPARSVLRGVTLPAYGGTPPGPTRSRRTTHSRPP